MTSNAKVVYQAVLTDDWEIALRPYRNGNECLSTRRDSQHTRWVVDRREEKFEGRAAIEPEFNIYADRFKRGMGSL
jgi:hypothetical protein